MYDIEADQNKVQLISSLPNFDWLDHASRDTDIGVGDRSFHSRDRSDELCSRSDHCLNSGTQLDQSIPNLAIGNKKR